MKRRTSSAHSQRATDRSSAKVDPESHVRTVAGMPAISLRPVREDPNVICSVTWHSLLTMPEEYPDITSFGDPTVGLTIHLSEVPDDMTVVVGDGPTSVTFQTVGHGNTRMGSSTGSMSESG